MGWIAELPDADRLALLADVRTRLTATEYHQSWETFVGWTRRRPEIGVPLVPGRR